MVRQRAMRPLTLADFLAETIMAVDLGGGTLDVAILEGGSQKKACSPRRGPGGLQRG